MLKYIYINYLNNLNSPATTGYVVEYRYDGTTTDLQGVSSRAYSTTGTGYYFDLSPEFTATVDNLTYGYVFVWTGPQLTDPGTQSPQYLCSLQVGYYPPSIFGVALPVVTR